MIKKFFLIFSFLSLFIGYAKSQNSPFKPEWNFGIGVGPTYSTISFESVDRSKRLRSSYVLGYSGGIFARYISDKYVGIQAELNYSRLGWAEDFGTDNIQNYEFKQTFDYIELPILTHIYIGDKTRFIINFGPKIGVMLSYKNTMNSALSDSIAAGHITEENHIMHQYTNGPDIKFDYGLMAGLGAEFRTGIGHFSLEGRYAFGLGDIYDNSKTTGVFSRSAHRSIYVRLTYFIKPF